MRYEMNSTPARLRRASPAQRQADWNALQQPSVSVDLQPASETRH